MSALYYKANAEYEPGQSFLGGGEQALDGGQASGAVLARDALTGERQCEFECRSYPGKVK